MRVRRWLWRFVDWLMCGSYRCPLCGREFRADAPGTGTWSRHYGSGSVICPTCTSDGTLAKAKKQWSDRPHCNTCQHLQMSGCTIKTGWCTALAMQVEIDFDCLDVARFSRQPDGKMALYWSGEVT